MIKFTLAGKVTEYDDGTLSNREAILLEKTTGRTIVDLETGFVNGKDMEATCAFYWLALRRADGPEAAGRYTDLDFDLAHFEVTRVVPDVVVDDPTAAADPSSAADTDAHQVAALEPQHAAAI